MKFDFEKLCKLLALAESDNPAERNMAISAAVSYARKAGMSLGEAVRVGAGVSVGPIRMPNPDDVRRRVAEEFEGALSSRDKVLEKYATAYPRAVLRVEALERQARRLRGWVYDRGGSEDDPLFMPDAVLYERLRALRAARKVRMPGTLRPDGMSLRDRELAEALFRQEMERASVGKAGAQ